MRALEHDELALNAQPILALRTEQTFPVADVLVRLQEDDATYLLTGEAACRCLNVFAYCYSSNPG